jgi:hypothetical protein
MKNKIFSFALKKLSSLLDDGIAAVNLDVGTS